MENTLKNEENVINRRFLLIPILILLVFLWGVWNLVEVEFIIYAAAQLLFGTIILFTSAKIRQNVLRKISYVVGFSLYALALIQFVRAFF